MTLRNIDKSAMRFTPNAETDYTDSNNKQWKVLVEFKVKRGRPDFHSLTIKSTSADAPITRRLLQELPLDQLFNEVLAKETAVYLKKYKQGSAKKHQGRAHSDAELMIVAEIYKKAYNGHQPVNKAIAVAFGIGQSTAAKRIMASRERGFIPSEINKKENR